MNIRERSGHLICLGLAAILGLLASCSEQPAVENENFFSPALVHARFTDPCTVCHEDGRLPASDGVEHGFGRDCGECHESSDDEGAKRPWKPKFYSHRPPPEECLGCHAGDRPSRATHPENGDCASCHKFPAWLPPDFG